MRPASRHRARQRGMNAPISAAPLPTPAEDLVFGLTRLIDLPGLTAAAGAPPAYQNVFGETLAKLAETDDRICAITAAMPSGTGRIVR